MPQNFSLSPSPSPTPTSGPVLGNYSNATVLLSANTTITPDAVPSNTPSLTVATSTNFKGRLEVDSTTAVVQVTNAHPAGTHTVTVTGFDGTGTTAKTFTLTVTTPGLATRSRSPRRLASPLELNLNQWRWAISTPTASKISLRPTLTQTTCQSCWAMVPAASVPPPISTWARNLSRWWWASSTATAGKTLPSPTLAQTACQSC